jgi:hypothetical protein
VQLVVSWVGALLLLAFLVGRRGWMIVADLISPCALDSFLRAA